MSFINYNYNYNYSKGVNKLVKSCVKFWKIMKSIEIENFVFQIKYFSVIYLFEWFHSINHLNQKIHSINLIALSHCWPFNHFHLIFVWILYIFNYLLISFFNYIFTLTIFLKLFIINHSSIFISYTFFIIYFNFSPFSIHYFYALSSSSSSFVIYSLNCNQFDFFYILFFIHQLVRVGQISSTFKEWYSCAWNCSVKCIRVMKWRQW